MGFAEFIHEEMKEERSVGVHAFVSPVCAEINVAKKQTTKRGKTKYFFIA
jgi:hypothetical protein